MKQMLLHLHWQQRIKVAFPQLKKTIRCKNGLLLKITWLPYTAIILPLNLYQDFNGKLLQSFIPFPISFDQIMQYRQEKYLEVTSFWWTRYWNLLPKLALFVQSLFVLSRRIKLHKSSS
jgi:hypothetical protein